MMAKQAAEIVALVKGTALRPYVTPLESMRLLAAEGSDAGAKRPFSAACLAPEIWFAAAKLKSCPETKRRDADLLLMDDRRGVTVAVQRGLNVTGTMGLLARAASRGIVDLAQAFERLKRTNFRYRQETMDLLLKESGKHSS